MADLDDFFAKKDRKKSKTKKYSTTEEVAKKLEDNNKKVDKPVKKVVTEGDETGAEIHDLDEWKDFEEEKKDYTGLKIGNLTINSELENQNTGQDSNYEQQETTYDEAGNEVEKKVGPWKRMGNESTGSAATTQGQQQTQADYSRVEERRQESAPTTNVVSGTYVPPSKRNQPSQPQSMQSSRLRSKAAPDIHNEEYFPTLSGAKEQKQRSRNEGSFEVVSHSKSNSLRYVEQQKGNSQGPKLSLGNRYNTLSNDS